MHDVYGEGVVLADPDLNFRSYPEELAKFGVLQTIEEGFPLALGFAQRGGLYKRVGGVPVEADYEMHLEARQIPPLADADDPFGEFDEAKDLEIAHAERLHKSRGRLRIRCLAGTLRNRGKLRDDLTNGRERTTLIVCVQMSQKVPASLPVQPERE